VTGNTSWAEIWSFLSLMTFHTIITKTSSGSWISRQQVLQTHMEISNVSKYLAHQPYSIKVYRSLHNIFIDYPENIIHFGIRKINGIKFFSSPLSCRLMLLLKRELFNFFIVHTILFHDCKLKTRLDLHSLSASRPSVNTATSVTRYTVYRQTDITSTTQNSGK